MASHAKNFRMENWTEMSGFALEKNNKNFYWINSTAGNKKNKSNNYDDHVRNTLKYKILFQLHTHPVNGPSEDDIYARNLMGLDVFSINGFGDIWRDEDNNQNGKEMGNYRDYWDIFKEYGIKN